MDQNTGNQEQKHKGQTEGDSPATDPRGNNSSRNSYLHSASIRNYIALETAPTLASLKLLQQRRQEAAHESIESEPLTGAQQHQGDFKEITQQANNLEGKEDDRDWKLRTRIEQTNSPQLAEPEPHATREPCLQKVITNKENALCTSTWFPPCNMQQTQTVGHKHLPYTAASISKALRRRTLSRPRLKHLTRFEKPRNSLQQKPPQASRDCSKRGERWKETGIRATDNVHSRNKINKTDSH